MQDELAKELYDVSYEIDFDIKIEEKSDKPKNRTKNGNEITVINTITISELFNTKMDILFEIIKKLNDLYIANENYSGIEQHG